MISIEKLSPSPRCDYLVVVKRYGDGHISYNLERNEELMYAKWKKSSEHKIEELMYRLKMMTEKLDNFTFSHKKAE